MSERLEKLAKELADKAFSGSLVGVPGWTTDLEAAISSALLSERDRALEEAAIYEDEMEDHVSAKRIRSLKSKQ